MPARKRFGGRRSRRDLSVRIVQADLQMVRFDKLGFNALIEVYENFLFFDCKGRDSLAVFLRSSKKMKKITRMFGGFKKSSIFAASFEENGE